MSSCEAMAAAAGAGLAFAKRELIGPVAAAERECEGGRTSATRIERWRSAAQAEEELEETRGRGGA